MSNYGESFRQNIQCVVQESGYTVQEFSKSIGLDDKTIYNFLEGYCLPHKWVHRKYNPLPTFSVVGMLIPKVLSTQLFTVVLSVAVLPFFK